MELLGLLLLYFERDALLLVLLVLLLASELLFFVFLLGCGLTLGFRGVARGEAGLCKLFEMRVLMEELLVTNHCINIEAFSILEFF